MEISTIIDTLERNYKEQFERLREDQHMALYDRLINGGTIFLVYKKKEDDNYKYLGYIRADASELEENPEKWFNNEFRVLKVELPPTLGDNESYLGLIARDVLKRSEKTLEEQKLGGN